MQVPSAIVPAVSPAADLPFRLRRETAALHAEVERVVGLPDGVPTRGAYGELLQHFNGLHRGLEPTFCRWAHDFAALGIDIAAHRRSTRIAADLAALGLPTGDGVTEIAPRGFGQAVGCLYVLEGSALGGRVVARMLQARLGDIPTSFLRDGATEPGRWQRVLKALRSVPPADHPEVLRGAAETFAAFLATFAVNWPPQGGLA